MKRIKYIRSKDQYITEEGEIFTWVGGRAEELMAISPVAERLFEDCLGNFVKIGGNHYKATIGSKDIFNNTQ